MKRVYRWVMNPDNNPIMLLVTMIIIGLCVIGSFAMVTLPKHDPEVPEVSRCKVSQQ